MRIGKKKTPLVTEVVVKGTVGGRGIKPDSGVRSSQPDKVDISVSAKELMRAHRLMDTIPDIRTYKVESLKTMIQSASYNVDAEKVAVKIIERAIRDSIYVRGK